MTPEEFWKILHDMPPAPTVFYRLYYNEDTGIPVNYSMEDLPGTYITIDADTYARSSMRVRVKNGKLVPMSLPAVPKLVPSCQGTTCHPGDVALVVDPKHQNIKWSLRYNDTD